LVYEKLVKKWKPELSPSQFDRLKEFSRLMDRNSLWLGDIDTRNEIEVYYTDDAAWYCFTLQEIRELLDGLESGRTLNWEHIESNNQVDGPPT